VVEMRWERDIEEAMELIFRIQTDHGGRLPESEAREKLGAWVAGAAERAERLSWLVAKGSPAVLTVTYGGRKALDAAIASKNAVPPPHWFGGSIPHVQSPTGPVLPPGSYKPYEELRKRALEEGVLTQGDIDRVARSPRREDQPGEPEEYRGLYEASFPGRRWFMVDLRYAEDHPLGGGALAPSGYEGAYQVTATLTRRGSPNIPSVYVTDPNMMEGDSHLWLPEERAEGGLAKVYSVVHRSHEDGDTLFELVANRKGRLGQIRTVLRGENVGDVHRKAYRLLNPFLCDLSYRYDVPIEVLQINVAELATLTLGGVKDDDFREKTFDPETFFGSGISYGELGHYEFFTRLYREGLNSSSVDYGFLCFFRVAEGLILLRRRAIAEREGKPLGEVARPDVFLEQEIVEGDDADAFPPELHGESLWEAYKELKKERNKVGHAFLDEEDPLGGHTDIVGERLEDEERAGAWRAQARFIARRMLDSEFFASDGQAEEAKTD
jgi:hypothetical protein